MQFAQLKEPYTGDWFLLPESVARLAAHYDGARERPWIVSGCGALNPIIPIVPRSTQRWADHDDVEHPRHDGSCGQDECAIDCDGRIRIGTTEDLARNELTMERWSCHEPSDEVLDCLIRRQGRSPRRRRPRR